MSDTVTRLNAHIVMQRGQIDLLISESVRLTARVKELEAALADAGRALDGAARKMKGNCNGNDVNAVMLAAGRTAEARSALSTSQPELSDRTIAEAALIEYHQQGGVTLDDLKAEVAAINVASAMGYDFHALPEDDQEECRGIARAALYHSQPAPSAWRPDITVIPDGYDFTLSRDKDKYLLALWTKGKPGGGVHRHGYGKTPDEALKDALKGMPLPPAPEKEPKP